MAPRNRQFLDLVLVMTLAVFAAVAVSLLAEANSARVALALPLVLLLPGYALLAALLPDGRARDPAVRLVFSLGLSIALLVLTGLVLNATPWGLQGSSWTVSLCGETIVASLIAFVRRPRAPMPVRRRSPWIQLRQAGLICLAVAVAGTAVRISAQGATNQGRPGFTQLSILPANNNTAVSIHVACMELQPTTYRLELKQRDTTIAIWLSIQISPGAAWDATMALPQGETGHSPVIAALYRSNNLQTAYRHVDLWLPAKQ